MIKQISFLHVACPDAVRAQVAERLDSMHLFGNRLDSITARLHKSRENYEVELVAQAGPAGTLVAKSATGDLLAAVDAAIDRLTQQLRRQHGIKVSRRKHA
ncbi:MAG: HPF/RaiA family ribosome-associated protein [Planctomycetota bacterium]